MKLPNIPYIKNWKTHAEQLKQEVEAIAEQINDLLASKEITLHEAIKISIKEECDNTLSTSYNGVGMLLTKVLHNHQHIIQRLTKLHENIAILQNLKPLLIRISEVISPINTSIDSAINSFQQQTGINIKEGMFPSISINPSQYPHHQYRSDLSDLKQLINKDSSTSYSKKIQVFIDIVTSEIKKLAKDAELQYSPNDTIETIIDTIEQSVESDPAKRQHLIVNPSKLKSNQWYGDF